MTKSIKLRIVDKERFIGVLLISFIAVAILIVFLVGQTSVQGQAKDTHISIYVKQGDTLWSIAQKYNHKNEDLRKLVRNIMIENKMETAMLYQGQEIKIPIQ